MRSHEYDITDGQARRVPMMKNVQPWRAVPKYNCVVGLTDGQVQGLNNAGLLGGKLDFKMAVFGDQQAPGKQFGVKTDNPNIILGLKSSKGVAENNTLAC